MSGEVTVPLPARRQGRHGCARGAGMAPGKPDPGPGPAPDRIPRVARVLALAHRWQGLIRSGAVRDQADLARLVGVSRARVTQVMTLLWLWPGIQEAILLEAPLFEEPEAALMDVARQPVWDLQRSSWASLQERAR